MLSRGGELRALVVEHGPFVYADRLQLVLVHCALVVPLAQDRVAGLRPERTLERAAVQSVHVADSL